MQEQLRQLPAVDKVAGHLPATAAQSLRQYCARQGLQAVRQRLLDGESEALADPQQAVVAAAAEYYRRLTQEPLPTVINATGCVLHTGLGRAPLSARARAAAQRVLAGYCQLEWDPASGQRGNRQNHVAPLLCAVTGAEAALVVNNCAGATVLVLQALAHGRQVPVSRGELVEIGGSFRVPEIMACAGCALREIGATNRTHLDDYAQALGPETAMLLRVHQSNFVQQGFVAQVTTSALAKLAHQHGLPLVVDQGSGCCYDVRSQGYALAPMSDELRQGADLVCGSGDKLLGGPQAGLIIGRKDLVETCARHPLARALRCDKVTLAALAGTLQDYLGAEPEQTVPTLQMLLSDGTVAKRRAETIAREVGCGEVRAGRGAVGSGALPTDGPPSWWWCLRGAATAQQAALRHQQPAVVARVHDDELILDCATVSDDEVPLVIQALKAVITL